MTRLFVVAAERVFDAWLNPDMLRKCFFQLVETGKINYPILKRKQLDYRGTVALLKNTRTVPLYSF